MKYFPITLLILVLSTSAFAVDFTVNRITDEHDVTVDDGICAIAGGGCTLRAAIEQSNNNTNLSSIDRILFNLPANSTITLTTTNGGEIPIYKSNGTLEIVGTGANNLTIDGGVGTNRIFYTSNFTKLNISGVTLTGGNAGGATANNFGGAIFAQGSLILTRVHITGNTAPLSGGGIYTEDANSRIIESTISGNTASGGCGGLISNGRILAILNSTISGNTATSPYGGGGLCIINTFTAMNNVTITNNTANGGGGVSQFGDQLALGNTIIAGNISIDGIGPEILLSNSGSVLSLEGNLIGDSPGDAANTGISITYRTTDIIDQNPLLGILQNNGGTTPTHALLAGSPAIDRGVDDATADILNYNMPLITDERGIGFARISDGDGNGTATADIGAFEVQTIPAAAIVLVGGRIRNTKGRGIPNVRVTIIDSSGDTRTVLSNPFGYYNFTDIPLGSTYTFNVRDKRHTFSQTAQVYTITEEIHNLNFVANN